MEIVITASRILALPLLFATWLYQQTLSPDHGWLKPYYPYGFCKFHPSCSMYARIVLKEKGIIGLPKIIKRLIKCRPGVNPAVDLP